MDFIELGCALLRTSYVESFMAVAGYFGHGLTGSILGLLLLAHGYVYNNQRTKRAGIAVLAALIVAGIAAQTLKEIIQWPRAYNHASQDFPSGYTSAAFALTSVLMVTFPAFGPVFYLLAVLVALSRLYFRAHFIWDILGGVVIGHLAGLPLARTLITASHPLNYSLQRTAGWLGVAAIGIAGLAFFYSLEKNIGSHIVVPIAAGNVPAIATADFGTPQARGSLRHGWSVDEQWFGGKQSVVWATGLASELIMPLPIAQDYRFRLHVFPYSPKGPACQTIDVRLNNVKISTLFLDQGWHFYEFNVPGTTTKAGNNSLRFFYNYAESPQSRKRGSDKRELSVAFDTLEVFSAR